MNARDYYDWWHFTGIAIGYPMEGSNIAELQKNLSPAGVTTVICQHMMPDRTLATCDKDYMIGELSPHEGVRWTAALREIGAARLAAFVESSAEKNHHGAITQLAQQLALNSLATGQRMQALEALRRAGLRYYSEFDIEPFDELQVLLDQFVERHADELSADVQRHGDRRLQPGFRRHVAERDLEERLTVKRAWQDLEKFLPAMEERRQYVLSRLKEQCDPERIGGASNRLVGYYKRLHHLPPDLLSAAARQWLENFEQMMGKYPEAFSVLHRKHEEVALSWFTDRDFQWLSQFGAFRIEQGNKDSLRVSWAQPKGFDLGWKHARLTIMVFGISPHQPLPTAARDRIEQLRTAGGQLGHALSDSVLREFRNRYHAWMQADEPDLYPDDMKDEEILADVESVTILVLIGDPHSTSPCRIEIVLDTPWDVEHGLLLELDEAGGLFPST